MVARTARPRRRALDGCCGDRRDVGVAHRFVRAERRRRGRGDDRREAPGSRQGRDHRLERRRGGDLRARRSRALRGCRRRHRRRRPVLRGAGAPAPTRRCPWSRGARPRTSRSPMPARSPTSRMSPRCRAARPVGSSSRRGSLPVASALDWLERITGRPTEVLLTQAAASSPGANGVLALLAPWRRAPWWQPDAHAAFVGLTAASGPGDLARAIVESVAFDVARCLELIAPGATGLVVAGGGAKSQLWRDVLAAATARPIVRRAVDDAASVGARVIVGEAEGDPVDLDALNPVIATDEPDPDLVDRYLELVRTPTSWPGRSSTSSRPEAAQQTPPCPALHRLRVVRPVAHKAHPT